jgi:hypothetical protein
LELIFFTVINSWPRRWSTIQRSGNITSTLIMDTKGMTDAYGIIDSEEFSTLTQTVSDQFQGASDELDIHADDIGIKSAEDYSGYLSWLSNHPSPYMKSAAQSAHSIAGMKRSLDGLPFNDNEMPSYAVY